METNAYNSCTTYSGGFTVVYGLALFVAPKRVIFDDSTRKRTLAHFFDTHRISVPISWGSPPIQTE